MRRLAVALARGLILAAGFGVQAAGAVEPARPPESAKQADTPGFQFERFEIGPRTFIKPQLYNRSRGEAVDWFGNIMFRGVEVPRTSTYGLFSNRFQLGLLLTHADWLEAMVQYQDVTVVGVPGNSVGIGYGYYVNSPSPSQHSGYLRQGWLKLNSDGFYVSGGRMLFSDGNLGGARQKNLKWLQENRLSQRLIGILDFSAAGRSFDGGTVGFQNEHVEVAGFGFNPTFGGLNLQGMNTIQDIVLGGVSLNLKDSSAVGNTIAQLAWYTYQDTRPMVTVVDNQPGLPSPGAHIDIHTIAAHAAHVFEGDEGHFDLSAFGYGQLGRWQQLDQRAWAFGVELGYQWPKVWSSPWLRVGINSGSGDDDPYDGTHGTFFQMIPSVPLHAHFPFYNMMNVREVFAQLLMRPLPNVGVKTEFHSLSLNSADDLYYSGSGANGAQGFGYFGSPSHGQTDLAFLADMGVTVYLSKNVTTNFFFGHAFGQGVLQRNYSSPQGNFGLAEVIFTM